MAQENLVHEIYSELIPCIVMIQWVIDAFSVAAIDTIYADRGYTTSELFDFFINNNRHCPFYLVSTNITNPVRLSEICY